MMSEDASQATIFPPRICPCCGASVTQRRASPLTDEQAAKAYRRCLGRGYTRERLLAEEAATLDLIAPSMTDWLRALPPEVS
jgi:hypothetical protein